MKIFEYMTTRRNIMNDIFHLKNAIMCIEEYTGTNEAVKTLNGIKKRKEEELNELLNVQVED